MEEVGEEILEIPSRLEGGGNWTGRCLAIFEASKCLQTPQKQERVVPDSWTVSEEGQDGPVSLQSASTPIPNCSLGQT